MKTLQHVPREHSLGKPSALYLTPAPVVGVPPLSTERIGSQKNTATGRSNAALFWLSAADVYSGKWESLFLVILDIFNRESLPIAVIPAILYREFICALSLKDGSTLKTARMTD